MIFFQAIVDPFRALQNLVFEGFEWADPSALPQYNFLQADEEFVALLASHAIPLDCVFVGWASVREHVIGLL